MTAGPNAALCGVTGNSTPTHLSLTDTTLP